MLETTCLDHQVSDEFNGSPNLDEKITLKFLIVCLIRESLIFKDPTFSRYLSSQEQ